MVCSCWATVMHCFCTTNLRVGKTWKSGKNSTISPCFSPYLGKKWKHFSFSTASMIDAGLALNFPLLSTNSTKVSPVHFLVFLHSFHELVIRLGNVTWFRWKHCMQIVPPFELDWITSLLTADDKCIIGSRKRLLLLLPRPLSV